MSAATNHRCRALVVRRMSTTSGHHQFELLILLSAVVIAGVDLAPITTSAQAVVYLQKFGYLYDDWSSGGVLSPLVDLQSALVDFQRFALLTVTGVLDAETMAKMSQSRCGVPDIIPPRQPSDGRLRRRRRYVLGGNSWPTNQISFAFRNYSTKLDRQTVRKVVAKALQMWSNSSSIVFSETTSLDANIHVQFSIRDHADGFPFDGQGGVLAHTFYPPSGDTHFDEDEAWTDGIDTGTNLLQVTVHELGHALGLAHSSDPDAVMQPFYGGYNPNFRLGQDDISGIQSLYGKFSQPVTAAATTAVAPTTAAGALFTMPGPVVCQNASVDAITSVNQTVYVFIGNKYLLLDVVNGNGSYVTTVRNGFPRLLSDDWPGLGVSSVDAALYVDKTSNDIGRFYLFSGTRYWRYSSLPRTAVDSGYPKNIADGFPGVPDGLDSAFVWSKNNRTYFIKGAAYYRYTSKRGVDVHYPKPISLWTGLPTDRRINAAFRAPDMKTYFFTGTEFYQFDDVTFKAGDSRATARYWFNC